MLRWAVGGDRASEEGKGGEEGGVVWEAAEGAEEEVEGEVEVGVEGGAVEESMSSGSTAQIMS